MTTEQKQMKKITERAMKEANKLFQIITPNDYFKGHKEIRLCDLIEELNPSSTNREEMTEDDEKKLVSRFIATEYSKRYMTKARTEQERNLQIISCQYLIYKNFDEHFSYLREPIS